MLNIKKRIKQLQENTASLETKQICSEIIDNFTTVPEAQLSSALVEKLKTVSDSDKHVSKFIGTMEKLNKISNLGIASGISKIKESQIFSYPAVSYNVSKTENMLINQQLPEYMVVESVLQSFKAFVWDANIKEVYESIQSNYESMFESIILAKNIYNLKNSKGSFIYDNVIPKLEEHFENPTESSRTSILEELAKFNFSSDIRSLSESLKKISRNSDNIQIISENGKCTVSNLYSPVLLENGKEYFYSRGNHFSKENNIVTKLTEETASELPQKYKELCRIMSSPDIFVKEGKISFYLKRDRIDIFENESNVEVTFNGEKISSNELAKHMISAGLFRLEESQRAYDVQSIADSFSNIYNLDFAKIIESNVYTGSYVIIMKSGNEIYLNKVNESMKSNEFYSSMNATQARNSVLEFIGFDIKEALEEYLEKDEMKLKALREQQISIMKNIGVVEEQLVKVKNSLEDPYINENEQVIKLQEMLIGEISKLKNKHKEISSEIKIFEKKSSDAGVEAGDEIRIISSGELATISSIDSSQGIVSAITSGGKNVQVKTNDIESLEKKIEKAEEDNEDEEDESGKKKAKAKMSQK